ncbi:hypothetical protein OKW40_006912 [Paraburkholderia sp. RAU6.4a]|nr:hypothetical protein [Paraburkholderia sp. HC6.4b]MBB5450380.1 hypothetical protein [Paraburkholderia sp. Kb1A]
MKSTSVYLEPFFIFVGLEPVFIPIIKIIHP